MNSLVSTSGRNEDEDGDNIRTSLEQMTMTNRNSNHQNRESAAATTTRTATTTLTTTTETASSSGASTSSNSSSQRGKRMGASRGRTRRQHLYPTPTSGKRRGPRSKNAALWELAGGIAMYALCISLPTMLGVTVRIYQQNFSRMDGDFGDSRAWHWNRQQHQQQLAGNVLGGGMGMRVPSPSFWSSWWLGEIDEREQDGRQHQDIYSLVHSLDHESMGTTRKRLRNIPYKVYNFLLEKASAYAETNALSDVQFVSILSIALAMLRVFLVYLLVPRYLAPRRLAALVKCKSTHLLSSAEYQFGTSSDETLAVTASSEPSSNGIWSKLTHTFRRSLGHEAVANPNSMTHTITNNNTGHDHHHDNSNHYENLDATQALRLFSAPRYATAIFRLIFCTASCLWALYQFSSAQFWPVWVAGRATSQTKNCWNLSGSVTLGSHSPHNNLDRDFDHQNASLRYFFLAQASYQLHSICFHLVSMMLLLLYGGNRGKERFLSVRSSMTSYIRPLLEHSLFFLLIVGSFVFSALRRLGAIGIFALEFSSLFVQVLQVCVNAPEESNGSSWLKRPTIIRFVHRYLALPIFVYCRFFVLPFVVHFSAAFESAGWIRQMDRLLVPGFGMLLYLVFNGLLLVTFGLNLVYLRRLLFHPRVRNMTQKQQQQQ